LQNRVQLRLGPERWPAGEQLVEDGTQGVNVAGGAGLPGLAAGLLRGHVAGRAHDGPGPRPAGPRGQRCGPAAVGRLRDPGGRAPAGSTLAGLGSRGRTPGGWAGCTAPAGVSTSGAAWPAGNGVPASFWARLPPSTNSKEK